jgi:hypothetical protein
LRQQHSLLLVIVFGLSALMISLPGSAHAQNTGPESSEMVIPAGNEKLIRKMLTVPAQLMKAHDCGVENIQVKPTRIEQTFHCAQSSKKPTKWLVELRSRGAKAVKNRQAHKTKKFTLVVDSEMEVKISQALLEQVRRHEKKFKWVVARKAKRKK